MPTEEQIQQLRKRKLELHKAAEEWRMGEIRALLQAPEFCVENADTNALWLVYKHDWALEMLLQTAGIVVTGERNYPSLRNQDESLNPTFLNWLNNNKKIRTNAQCDTRNIIKDFLQLESNGKAVTTESFAALFLAVNRNPNVKPELLQSSLKWCMDNNQLNLHQFLMTTYAVNPATPVVNKNETGAQKLYQAACENLLAAQYNPKYQRNSKGMLWEADPANNLAAASKQFIDALRKLHQDTDIAYQLFEAVLELEQQHQQKHAGTIPFWIANTNFNEADEEYFQAYLKLITPLERYYVYLNTITREKARLAASGMNIVLSDFDNLLPAAYDYFYDHNYYLPNTKCTLEQLVDALLVYNTNVTYMDIPGLKLYRPKMPGAVKDPGKNNPVVDWFNILQFAQICYGPGALLQACKQRYEQRHEQNTPKQRKKSLIIPLIFLLAGVTLMAISIAALVSSYGLGTPLVLLGLKVGVDLIVASGFVGLLFTSLSSLRMYNKLTALTPVNKDLMFLSSFCAQSNAVDMPQKPQWSSAKQVRFKT